MTRGMYERHYGSRYDKTMSVKDCAAAIRADVKRLVKDGTLPNDWKYSVRYRSYAGGASIDVTATSPYPTQLMNTGQVAAGAFPRDVELAVDGQIRKCRIRPGERWHVTVNDVSMPIPALVHQTLQALMDSYNHDGSEVMVDYFDRKFYGHPVIDTAPGVPRAERPLPSYLPA